ncbi:MAG: hypothetical protein VSS75_023840 [Candidatus Parabeggiatoa sp.]|nr:hypothetical protein [Candidatus Parabeggiatoa sp.]
MCGTKLVHKYNKHTEPHGPLSNDSDDITHQLSVKCECHTGEEGNDKGLPIPNSSIFAVVKYRQYF